MGILNDLPELPVKEIATGKLSRQSLPFYVARQLKARNLKIDPSYAVIESWQMDNHHPVDNQYRYWILFAGLLCTAPAAVGTFIFYFLAVR